MGGNNMGYYSDPTASMALGEINREFSRLEKKAKKIRKLLEKGVISYDDVEEAQKQFKGIYRHILTNVLQAPAESGEDSQY